ncbi:hypothetical protein ACBR40_27285 [Nonomuraea sp. AD125B]|uniref:hypothetical protein n=1 Tax=Nonomuraea sp. AD125B TaxID=3242897 RepID=UPI0035291FDB
MFLTAILYTWRYEQPKVGHEDGATRIPEGLPVGLAMALHLVLRVGMLLGVLAIVAPAIGRSMS